MKAPLNSYPLSLISVLLSQFLSSKRDNYFSVKSRIFMSWAKPVQSELDKNACKFLSCFEAKSSSFTNSPVDGAALCDSKSRASTMKQLFPVSTQQFLPLFRVFLVACSIYFNVYLCVKPVSEWLDTPLICGLQGGKGSAAYSHDILGLCRAKKTFSGTPNPWAPAKYHNPSVQLTQATWDT